MLQALVQQGERQALNVHSPARILNLVLRDVSEKVDMCRDFLGMIPKW